MTTGAKAKLANLYRRTVVIQELCEFIPENFLIDGGDTSLVMESSHVIDLVREYTRMLENVKFYSKPRYNFYSNVPTPSE